MYKKGDVGYDDGGGQGSRKCGNCVYFIEPNSCRKVEGDIDSDAVCELFEQDTTKEASLLFHGFAEKVATPSRGRIISDVSLIMDNDYTEDPGLKPRKGRVVHTMGERGGGRYMNKTHQHELKRTDSKYAFLKELLSSDKEEV